MSFFTHGQVEPITNNKYQSQYIVIVGMVYFREKKIVEVTFMSEYIQRPFTTQFAAPIDRSIKLRTIAN